VNQNDILQAIEAAMAPDDGDPEALTTEQLAGLVGLGEKSIRKALKELQRMGRLDVVKTHRPAVDGAFRIHTAYKVKV